MANIKKDKSNFLFLFLELLLIGYIVYWFFTDNYKKANDHSFVYGLADTETQTAATQVQEEKKSEFSLNEITAKSKAKGRELYDMSCKSCHGAEGNGDGDAGKMINPKPRNFHNVSEYKFGITLENLLSSVQKGSPGTSMAGFDFLPLDDQIAVVHYISQWVPSADTSNKTANKNSDKNANSNTQVVAQVEDLSQIKLDSVGVTKSSEALSIKTSKKTLNGRPQNAEEALLQLFAGSNKQAKISPLSHVVISNKDHDYSMHLKDINSFIEFINSEYVRFNTGFSYSHLNYNDVSLLYKKVTSK